MNLPDKIICAIGSALLFVVGIALIIWAILDKSYVSLIIACLFMVVGCLLSTMKEKTGNKI